MRGWHRVMVGAAVACLVAPPAHADELQARILAGAVASRADSFSFRRTLTMDATGEKRKVVVHQYDPRAAPTARWKLISIDGQLPTPKQVADSGKAKYGPVPGYARLAEWIGAPASRADAGPGYILYKFPRLPAGVVKFGSHDASADTRAEALVNVKGRIPFVERVRFTSTKGFRMMLVASVTGVTIDGRYRQLPDGTPVPDANYSVISGSMMGKSGQMRTRTDYSAFDRVR